MQIARSVESEQGCCLFDFEPIVNVDLHVILRHLQSTLPLLLCESLLGPSVPVEITVRATNLLISVEGEEKGSRYACS